MNNNRNKKSENEQTNNTSLKWNDLSIFAKLVIIFIGILITIFIILPGIAIVLSELFPNWNINTTQLNTLISGLQIVVGVASLILAISSMIYAGRQDKKISDSLKKLDELDKKINLTKQRKTLESNEPKKGNADEK